MQTLKTNAGGSIVRKREFDKYGEPTGTFYWECAVCGYDCIYRDVVEAHDCEGAR